MNMSRPELAPGIIDRLPDIQFCFQDMQVMCEWEGQIPPPHIVTGNKSRFKNGFDLLCFLFFWIISADIESGSPDRLTTLLLGIGSAQDPSSGSRASANPSAPIIWHDVDDGCYVDESRLVPSLELGEPSCSLARTALGGQRSLYHHPQPSANEIDQHESDGTTQRSPIEPTAYPIPELADQDEGGWNDICRTLSVHSNVDYAETRSNLLRILALAARLSRSRWPDASQRYSGKQRVLDRQWSGQER